MIYIACCLWCLIVIFSFKVTVIWVILGLLQLLTIYEQCLNKIVNRNIFEWILWCLRDKQMKNAYRIFSKIKLFDLFYINETMTNWYWVNNVLLIAICTISLIRYMILIHIFTYRFILTFELCVITYLDYMYLWFSRRIMQFAFCHLNIGAYLDNTFHYILWSAGLNTSNKENRWKCWHHPLKKFIFLKLKLLRNIMNRFKANLWPWKVWDEIKK